jgi:hypothetical protein
MQGKILKPMDQKNASSKGERKLLPAAIFKKSHRQTKVLNSLAYVVYQAERAEMNKAPAAREILGISAVYLQKAKEKNISIPMEDVISYFKHNLTDLELSYQRMRRKQKVVSKPSVRSTKKRPTNIIHFDR